MSSLHFLASCSSPFCGDWEEGRLSLHSAALDPGKLSGVSSSLSRGSQDQLGVINDAATVIRATLENQGYMPMVVVVHVVVTFSSLARIWGKVIHFPPALFVCLLFFFNPHRFHFLGQSQSTVAQRAKTTVAECSLSSCM